MRKIQALKYQSGFGNTFSSEAVRGAADRTELAATSTQGPVRGGALGDRLHRTARREPEHMDVQASPERDAAPFQARRRELAAIRAIR
jgi:hypothetical protein